MEILEKVDWNLLNTYIENNLIIANKHQVYDIWVLNYSPKAHINNIWDLYTLSCRGLIIDLDGNILCRPFQRFKNVEQYLPSEIDMSLDFEIFEKIDGFLMLLFFYKPRMEWIIASRSSFLTEQSIEAKKIINKDVYNILDENLTYILEYIAPDSVIVVRYGDIRDVILLAVINTKTGDEIKYLDVKKRYSKYFTIIKKHCIKNISNLIDLKKNEENNKEGFVVKFSNNFRVKVKFDEYIRLHGIMSNISELTIWEHLKNNYDFDVLLKRVPDEYFNWITLTIKKMLSEFNEIERLALKEFVRIYCINEITDRKEFAAIAIKTRYRSILFNLFDKKSYDEIIWEMIKPINSDIVRL